MPEIDVLVPYETKNYIKNPSFEVDTTGWNAVGSSISVVLTRARFERASLRIETDNAAMYEGVYYRINDTTLKGVVHASAYIRGSGKVRIKIKDGLTGRQSIGPGVDLHDKYFQRLFVQGYAEGTDDTRVYIETCDLTQAADIYIDGAQLELGEYLSTFCDGSQPDCRWNGVKNASTSQRTATSPNGGRWVSIRDDECDPSTYITTFSGLGLPPITINRQQMALSPGSFFDSMRVNERVFQLTVNIKDDYAQRRNGLGKVRLNKLRQHLTDLIKPDRDPNTEPMWLRYRDGDRSLMLRAVYESGLEFDGDFRNKWINAIPLRFLALDPFWYEDSQEVAMLDTETTLGNDLANFSRVDGVWGITIDDLEVPGFSYGPQVIEEDHNGRLYFGGYFTQDGNGISVRRFGSTNDDFTQIVERATGLNGAVLTISAHPNGKIYIGGVFTGDNAGNSFDRVCEYDPDADTFAALGGGVDDNDVRSSFVAPNGWVYFVGTFTTVDASPANRIAYWDGGSWHTVGNIQAELTTGGTIELRDIFVVSEDEIYVVGRENGGTSNAMLMFWDGDSWSILDTATYLVSGPPEGYSITKDISGNMVYVTIQEDSTGVFSLRLKLWNGSSVSQLGGNVYVSTATLIAGSHGIDVDQDGNILISGRFDTVGSLIFNSFLLIWNGSSFVFSDIEVSNISFVGPVKVTSTGDIYLSSSVNPVDNVAGSGITIVENKSTASVFPIISVSGSGKIVWLENQTTRQRMYLNYTLQENELITLDFRTGIKTVESNYRGSIQNAILPESDDIGLSPKGESGDGDNKIACLIVDEVDPVVQLRYQPTHWSVDAIANQ